VADVVLIQDLVDGLLFVVRSRRTPREAISEALGRIRSDKVIGIVLNDHREYRDSYMAYAYQAYGMSKDRKGSSGPHGPVKPPSRAT
jgi:Mrp family chromosome partitioning ATPase